VPSKMPGTLGTGWLGRIRAEPGRSGPRSPGKAAGVLLRGSTVLDTFCATLRLAQSFDNESKVQRMPPVKSERRQQQEGPRSHAGAFSCRVRFCWVLFTGA
jgi:hypothetical protein